MTRIAWLFVALLIVAHLIVDAIVPLLLYPSLDAEWLLAIAMGICVSQVILIGVWGALTPGRVMLRLPWSVFLAMLMWYANVLGNRMRVSWHSWGSFDQDVALQLGLIILTGVVVVQIPLWAASRLFRWRLLPPDCLSTSNVDEKQFRIIPLIFGMLVASIALALGRIVLPEGSWQIAHLHRELHVLLPVVAIVNLIVALPCLWGAFAPVRWLGPLVAGWVLYAVLVSLLEVLFLTTILGGSDDEIWYLMAHFNISQCIGVFVSLICLRAIGFRLKRLPKPELNSLPHTDDLSVHHEL